MFHRMAAVWGLVARAAGACGLVLLAGCSSGESGGPLQPRPHPDERYFASAPSAIVDGRTLRLTAYVWRDFMPFVGEDGSALIATAVIAAEGGALPAGLTVENLIVRNGSEVWVAGAPGNPIRSDDATMMATVAGGPRWEVGSPVDVLVRLRDAGGRRHYLAVRGVAIERTD